jgi:hypothetical protein
MVTSEELFSLAACELRQRRVAEALRLFTLAEEAGYDADECAGSRWIAHMLAGQFESAWQESDAIAARGKPDAHCFWDGKPVQGRRVLIRCLHGLGDTLQFIRYVPLIRAMARSVGIEAQPALKLLLEQAEIADAVVTWGEPEPAWDQQIEIIELPRIFRTTLDSIPNQVPYLHVKRAEKTPSEYNASQPLQVGLVWAASSYNPARSLRFEEMAELLDVSGIAFGNLQAGDERGDLAGWNGRLADLYDDSVLTMARHVSGLHLVITVDTMMAHLAGAMGRPVWTLLPYEGDWRWMLDREDSPWYPTMRLFRQRKPGDWRDVIARVKDELKVLVASIEAR